MASSSKLSITKSNRILSVKVESNKEYGELSSIFIKQFGQELGRYVYLQDPIGNTFKLRFAKSATRGFLTDGFTNLISFYGLGHLYWLDLKYLGDSFFSMTIDDSDLNEIDYRKATIKQELSSDIDSNKSDTPLAQTKSDDASDCFSTILTKYKATASQLNIPAMFADIHMPPMSGDWILRDSDGVDFPCKYISSKRRKTEVKLGSGWKSFCKVKKLKAGDKCVFHIADEKEKVLNVTIIRK